MRIEMWTFNRHETSTFLQHQLIRKPKGVRDKPEPSQSSKTCGYRYRELITIQRALGSNRFLWIVLSRCSSRAGTLAESNDGFLAQNAFRCRFRFSNSKMPFLQGVLHWCSLTTGMHLDPMDSRQVIGIENFAEGMNQVEVDTVTFCEAWLNSNT